MNAAATHRLKGSKPSITVYDSARLDAQESFAYCSQAICAVLSPTETSSFNSSAGRFDAYLKNISFGSLQLNQYKTCPVRDVRSKKMLRSNPDEDFYILRALNGKGTLVQGGKEATLLPGDIAMYDSAKEFTWQWESAAEMQIAKVPREALLRKSTNAENLVARKISGASPFSIMLGNVLDGALTATEYNDEFDVARYAHTLTDMLATCIDLSLSSANAPRTENTLARAKKVLMDNLGNCDFDLAGLSTSLSISGSSIARAFAAEGTTPIRWLWSKRLEYAYELASNGSFMTVSQIALESGFTEFAHFSRSFKKTYGVSPSDFMLAHRK